MLREATDIVGEKPAIESQETSQDTPETTPEILQEVDTEVEDNQKEAVALKTEEGIMKMIEIGRLWQGQVLKGSPGVPRSWGVSCRRPHG